MSKETKISKEKPKVAQGKVEEVKKPKLKKYSKSELSAMAKESFKALKNIDKLYSTEDGQFFYTESDALLHGKAKKFTVSEHKK